MLVDIIGAVLVSAVSFAAGAIMGEHRARLEYAAHLKTTGTYCRAHAVGEDD